MHNAHITGVLIGHNTYIGTGRVRVPIVRLPLPPLPFIAFNNMPSHRHARRLRAILITSPILVTSPHGERRQYRSSVRAKHGNLTPDSETGVFQDQIPHFLTALL
jgi:hypothetical protein